MAQRRALQALWLSLLLPLAAFEAMDAEPQGGQDQDQQKGASLVLLKGLDEVAGKGQKGGQAGHVESLVMT